MVRIPEESRISAGYDRGSITGFIAGSGLLQDAQRARWAKVRANKGKLESFLSDVVVEGTLCTFTPDTRYLEVFPSFAISHPTQRFQVCTILLTILSSVSARDLERPATITTSAESESQTSQMVYMNCRQDR